MLEQKQRVGRSIEAGRTQKVRMDGEPWGGKTQASKGEGLHGVRWGQGPREHSGLGAQSQLCAELCGARGAALDWGTEDQDGVLWAT